MKYREISGWKYELAEDEMLETGIRIPAAVGAPLFYMHTDGFLCINRGYAWDGPSGPAIDTKNFLRASLVHDVLYQMIRMGFMPSERRAEADALLRKLCRQDGMSAVRAFWVFYSVRVFGWTAIHKNAKDTEGIKEAP